MSENKTGKYLKYAIGEIILVVIGILIALGINNMNQERIKQDKVDSILVKIQNDLLQDVSSGNWLIRNYVAETAMKNLISSGNLTSEDVKEFSKSGNSSWGRTIYFWNTYELHTNGYKQLMTLLDDMPKKYDELIEQLNNNYTWQGVFETMTENCEEIVQRYKYYVADNHSWRATDDYSGEISEEQMDYIINNFRFKNHVALLDGSKGSMVWGYNYYRKGLMKTYIMINEILGENARAIPKQIRSTSLSDESDAERLVGTYTLSAGPDYNHFGNKLEISNKGKDLYIKSETGETYGPLLFMDSEKPWFSFGGWSSILRFENNGKNSLSITHPFHKQTAWLKVVDD